MPLNGVGLVQYANKLLGARFGPFGGDAGVQMKFCLFFLAMIVMYLEAATKFASRSHHSDAWKYSKNIDCLRTYTLEERVSSSVAKCFVSTCQSRGLERFIHRHLLLRCDLGGAKAGVPRVKIAT